MGKVKIEYYGHACFRLTCGGQRIVLDPYSDGSVPGLKKLRTEAEFVYCSHDHHDHNAVLCVKLKAGAAPNFRVEELQTDHDDAGGTLRGKNTVRIFTFGKLRIAHFGDLGRPLTAKEQAKLRGLDCALIPIGGCYTVDAATAKDIIDAIDPAAVIPMHYRSESAGYDEIGTLDEFFLLFDGDRPDILPLTVGGWVEFGK